MGNERVLVGCSTKSNQPLAGEERRKVFIFSTAALIIVQCNYRCHPLQYHLQVRVRVRLLYEYEYVLVSDLSTEVLMFGAVRSTTQYCTFSSSSVLYLRTHYLCFKRSSGNHRNFPFTTRPFPRLLECHQAPLGSSHQSELRPEPSNREPCPPSSSHRTPRGSRQQRLLHFRHCCPSWR